MKATVQAIVFVLMVSGLFAASTFPTHSTITPILSEGGGPRPLCAPGDKTCNPGPLFPGGNVLAEGGGPRPLCAPGDKTCNPGPLFPGGNVLAEGGGPRPLCAPGDKTCNPGPLFPGGNAIAR